MKHLKKRRELGRDTSQRKALLKTLAGSLVMREKIKTTEAKAKELKNYIDKLISKAKKGKKENLKLSIRRDLIKFLPEMAIKKITGEFLDKFSKRDSGYTRIIKLPARKSDGAKVAVIELITN